MVMRARKTYLYNCVDKKENPTEIVKWLRRNLGERGKSWDFSFIKGNVSVDIFDDKAQVIYELWYT